MILMNDRVWLKREKKRNRATAKNGLEKIDSFYLLAI